MSPRFTPQQREAMALCAEFTRRIPYVTNEGCARVTAVLLPLLREAVHNEKDALPADFDQLRGADLLAHFEKEAALPGREDASQPIRKRARSPPDELDAGAAPDGAWCYETHNNIAKVIGVGRNVRDGPLGLFLAARRSGGHGNEAPGHFFATLDELRHIDSVPTVKKMNRLVGVLREGLVKYKLAQPALGELIAGLRGMQWSQGVVAVLTAAGKK